MAYRITKGVKERRDKVAHINSEIQSCKFAIFSLRQVRQYLHATGQNEKYSELEELLDLLTAQYSDRLGSAARAENDVSKYLQTEEYCQEFREQYPDEVEGNAFCSEVLAK